MLRTLLLSVCLGGTVLLALPSVADAQYYPPGNGGYYPPPPPPPPYRYDEAPPPPPPGYYGRRVLFGRRCEATAATPSGGQRVVCALRRGRPVDDNCECPPPPPPPGYSYGPPLPGRVIP